MQFKAKNGEVFEFRPLKEGDAQQCMEFINSLVDEKALIRINKKVTLGEEEVWLKDTLRQSEEGKLLRLVAEKDGVIVANCQIARVGGNQDHVGVFAVAVKQGFRGMGIGKRLGEAVLEMAPGAGIEVVHLHVVVDNDAAKNLYRSLGFIPLVVISKDFKMDEQYRNSIMMRLDLAKNRQKTVP